MKKILLKGILALAATMLLAEPLALAMPSDSPAPAEQAKKRTTTTKKKSGSRSKSSKSSKTSAAKSTSTTTAKVQRPVLADPPKPDYFLEEDQSNNGNIMAYAGTDYYVRFGDRWARYDSRKPGKKPQWYSATLERDAYVLSDGSNEKIEIQFPGIMVFLFKKGTLQQDYGKPKVYYPQNTLTVGGFNWFPSNETYDGIYADMFGFLLRSGNYWREYHPEKFHGVWAEYQLELEDKDNYIIANSTTRLKVPKKMNKDNYTYVTDLSNNSQPMSLNLISDTHKNSPTTVPAKLRTSRQSEASNVYRLMTENKNGVAGSKKGTNGYLSVMLGSYMATEDKNGPWYLYSEDKPDEKPKEYWLIGENDESFILRDRPGDEIWIITKNDGKSYPLPNTLHSLKFAYAVTHNVRSSFNYFKTPAREVYAINNGGYLVKDGYSLFLYDDNGQKDKFEIFNYKEGSIYEGESPATGTKIKLTPRGDVYFTAKNGTKTNNSVKGFESNTWAPRPKVKTQRMIAYEKEQARLAAAEKKRQAELAAAEKKRKAEQAAAEKKRQAELAKAQQQRAVSTPARTTTTTASTHTHNSSSELKPCKSCNATGKIQCPICHGAGGSRCLLCGGSGMTTRGVATGRGVQQVPTQCPSCQGRGITTCLSCYGSGLINCFACSGKGRELTAAEAEIISRNNREMAEFYREQREQNEANHRNQRQQERKEYNEHLTRRSRCTHCNGTGADPLAESSQPSIGRGIKHYNPRGNKCPYCHPDNYSEHWHAQCSYCK